jgi:hypothetical protein
MRSRFSASSSAMSSGKSGAPLSSSRGTQLGAPGKTLVPKEAVEDTRYKNVFTCSMADLFGGWVPNEVIEAVLEQARKNEQ